MLATNLGWVWVSCHETAGSALKSIWDLLEIWHLAFWLGIATLDSVRADYVCTLTQWALAVGPVWCLARLVGLVLVIPRLTYLRLPLCFHSIGWPISMGRQGSRRSPDAPWIPVHARLSPRMFKVRCSGVLQSSQLLARSVSSNSTLTALRAIV